MTDKGLLKREHAKDVYGPLQERTLRNVHIKKLYRFAPSVDGVKPGKMVGIARSAKDKREYGKRSADTEAKRAILSLVTEEDTDTLAKEGRIKQIKDKRIIRLINETKQQGIVLSLADLSAIMLLAPNTLSKRG
jgi:hypothetical protein